MSQEQEEAKGGWILGESFEGATVQGCEETTQERSVQATTVRICRCCCPPSLHCAQPPSQPPTTTTLLLPRSQQVPKDWSRLRHQNQPSPPAKPAERAFFVFCPEAKVCNWFLLISGEYASSQVPVEISIPEEVKQVIFNSFSRRSNLHMEPNPLS